MILLNLNNISKSYGDTVLSDVSFDLKDNEKVGIIGKNGSGKSTLLNIIMKIEKQDCGTVSVRNGKTMEILTQKKEKKNINVKDYLYEQVKEITDIEVKLKKLENEMQDADNINKVIDKYIKLQELFISMNGYEVSEKIGKATKQFKLDSLLDKNFNDLSGGEKQLVCLGRIMINRPDILLLDEPTNHLDITTLEWLESFLNDYKGALLIVSHDRYFLDKVVDKIVLLEDGKSIVFNGNYSYFISENEKRKKLLREKYDAQMKKINQLEKASKQLRQWGAIGNNEDLFKRAKAIERRIEKEKVLEKPKSVGKIPLQFSFDDRSSKEVIVLKNYNLCIGERKLLTDINLKVFYGDKICLMGKNGCGKTTFIKNIIDSHVMVGNNINVGYMPQELIFDFNIRLLDYARNVFVGDESHLRSALAKFLFTKEVLYKYVNDLSGGEKIRLKLFELMQLNSNFLILDEPTNHIDIDTREVVEQALLDFKGTILFISHDRYFINKLATKIFYIDNNDLKEYLGNYDYYKEKISR